MNKIMISGRLVRDPELKSTASDKLVATFTLAVNRRFKNPQGEYEADFINVVVWGKQAESCGNYLYKGKRAIVDGRLQIRSYETKDGSGRRYVTEVIAEQVEFLDFGDKQKETSSSNSAFDEEIPF